MIPEENPAEVEADACASVIADAAAQVPGITVEIKRLLLAHALKPLPGNAAAGRGAAEARRRRCSASPFPTSGTPLYTDVRLYGERGIPAVIYGAGPRTVLESQRQARRRAPGAGRPAPRHQGGRAHAARPAGLSARTRSVARRVRPDARGARRCAQNLLATARGRTDGTRHLAPEHRMPLIQLASPAAPCSARPPRSRSRPPCPRWRRKRRSSSSSTGASKARPRCSCAARPRATSRPRSSTSPSTPATARAAPSRAWPRAPTTWASPTWPR